MESGLRFPHYRRNEAVTRKDSPSRVMVNPVQASRRGRSEVRGPGKLRREGERNQSSEADEFKPARKAAGRSEGTRTENRHRWARRES